MSSILLVIEPLSKSHPWFGSLSIKTNHFLISSVKFLFVKNTGKITHKDTVYVLTIFNLSICLCDKNAVVIQILCFKLYSVLCVLTAFPKEILIFIMYFDV